MNEKSQSIATATGEALERAGLRTMTQRRRRIQRSLATVGLVTVVMLLLALLQRDQQSTRQCRRQVDAAIEGFRHAHRVGRVPPTTFPSVPQADAEAPDHFAYNILYAQLVRSTNPVGVFCCAEPHRLYLHESGRHLVTFDGQDFHVSWVPAGEFARRLEVSAFSRYLLRE